MFDVRGLHIINIGQEPLPTADVQVTPSDEYLQHILNASTGDYVQDSFFGGDEPLREDGPSSPNKPSGKGKEAAQGDLGNGDHMGQLQPATIVADHIIADTDLLAPPVEGLLPDNWQMSKCFGNDNEWFWDSILRAYLHMSIRDAGYHSIHPQLIQHAVLGPNFELVWQNMTDERRRAAHRPDALQAQESILFPVCTNAYLAKDDMINVGGKYKPDHWVVFQVDLVRKKMVVYNGIPSRDKYAKARANEFIKTFNLAYQLGFDADQEPEVVQFGCGDGWSCGIDAMELIGFFINNGQRPPVEYQVNPVAWKQSMYSPITQWVREAKGNYLPEDNFNGAADEDWDFMGSKYPPNDTSPRSIGHSSDTSSGYSSHPDGAVGALAEGQAAESNCSLSGSDSNTAMDTLSIFSDDKSDCASSVNSVAYELDPALKFLPGINGLSPMSPRRRAKFYRGKRAHRSSTLEASAKTIGAYAMLAFNKTWRHRQRMWARRHVSLYVGDTDPADLADLPNTGIEDNLNRCWTDYEKQRFRTGKNVGPDYQAKPVSGHTMRRLMLGLGRMTPWEWERMVIGMFQTYSVDHC